jgi:uncharacterized protein
MRFITILLILLSMEGCSQTNNNIIIGKTDSFYSTLLKEKRTIWVHLPRGMNDPLFNSQRYPVLYLLDGDAHFFSVAGMIQQFSEINGNTLCPEMIVVGIPNTDRQRDLTPTHTVTTFSGDSAGANTSGGGEIFTSFIEKELIPHIDSLYPTAPYRIIIGHSLGGLTVINTLLHHPRLFNAYLAIDPSMWWDKQTLLKQAGTVLTQDRFNGKTLFLAVANTMPPGMDTAKVRKDSTGNTIHIRSILLLAEALKKGNGNGLRWEYKYYDEDDHGSVPLISEYDGLRFIFNFYSYKNTHKLFDSSFSAALAIGSVSDHYKNISQEMGYKVLPPEPYVNGLGYSFLQNKMNEKAFAFFKLNIDNYPKSGNAYDSMGDYYVAMNDKQKAIDFFRKALTINENADTRVKLEKLEEKK